MQTGTWKKLAAGFAVAAAGVLGLGGTALAAPAHTAHPAVSYHKNGDYSFASNTADYGGSTFKVTGYPQTHSDSSQSLGADGVDLSISPSSGYADSGVIVDLGSLDSLFNGSGQYVGPSIAGSSNLEVNFYFDTSGNAIYNLNASSVYTGANGNNYASMGPADGTLYHADFGTFCGDGGMDESFTALGCNTLNMDQVKDAYAGEVGSEGVNTANPEVYAWIGISGSESASAYVTAVDGTDLVTATSPASDVITTRYVCGKSAATGFDFDVTLSGSYEAKVNFVSQDGPHGKSAWDGSLYIHPGHTDRVLSAKGYYGLGVFWDGDGSQPAKGEVGALYVYQGAPAAAQRVAC